MDTRDGPQGDVLPGAARGDGASAGGDGMAIAFVLLFSSVVVQRLVLGNEVFWYYLRELCHVGSFVRAYVVLEHAPFFAFLVIAVVRLRNGRPIDFGGLPGTFLLCFLGFALFTAFLAYAPAAAMVGLRGFVQTSVITYFVVVNTCKQLGRIKVLVIGMLSALAAANASAILQFCFSERPLFMGYRMLSFFAHRYYGHTNAHAMLIVVLLPFLVALFALAKRQAVRYAVGVAVALSAACVVLFASRTCLAILTLEVLVMLAVRSLRVRTWPLAVVTLMSLSLAIAGSRTHQERLVLVPARKAVALVRAAVGATPVPKSAPEAGRATVNSELSEYASGRWPAWSHGLTMFAERPLIGVGFKCFRPTFVAVGGSDLGSAHNPLVQLLGDTGLIGTTLFGTFVVLALLRVLQKIRALAQADSREAWETRTWCIALLAAIVVRYLYESVNGDPFGQIDFLLLALACAVPLDRRQAGS